ncbi:MAG: AraC family transcriptional regulator [Defluviitaleaceae bacterium]|nr:AraC family transcriptional regulator [Defluviitaleaceae bacterium]
MEWLKRMNAAIDFIDENINERIDYKIAAEIACCSLSRFQNMFLFISDIPLSEYVRRRRMALSAIELIDSEIKIIDLALKYGYVSPEAFARSFKAFHGVSPSDSRRFKKFIDYPKMSVHVQITGGHFNMESPQKMKVYKDILVKVEEVSYPESFKAVGLSYKDGFANIEDYGANYKDRITNKYEPYMEIGMGLSYDAGGDYIFGCRVHSLDDCIDGMIVIDTGFKNFVVVTFRSESFMKLVGGEDGPGEGMQTANEYINDVWLPEHMDDIELYKPDKIEHKVFKMNSGNIAGGCHPIEVYVDSGDTNPEMCYYIPLKDKKEKAK